jgi:hypothetical protein
MGVGRLGVATAGQVGLRASVALFGLGPGRRPGRLTAKSTLATSEHQRRQQCPDAPNGVPARHPHVSQPSALNPMSLWPVGGGRAKGRPASGQASRVGGRLHGRRRRDVPATGAARTVVVFCHPGSCALMGPAAPGNRPLSHT